MELPCEWCGEPTAGSPGEPLHCTRCRDREVEWQRNWEEIQRSGGQWNPSWHDPWWRAWLTSRDLFDWYHDAFPRHGERIGVLLDGEIFEYSLDDNHPVQAWISPSEVVVADVAAEDRSEVERRRRLHEFEGWIDHLRHSEPLSLGRLQGRSSYGAISTDCSPAPPLVKWAQAGDWAALAKRLRARIASD